MTLASVTVQTEAFKGKRTLLSSSQNFLFILAFSWNVLLEKITSWNPCFRGTSFRNYCL